jgi:hypothetical protein
LDEMGHRPTPFGRPKNTVPESGYVSWCSLSEAATLISAAAQT